MGEAQNSANGPPGHTLLISGCRIICVYEMSTWKNENKKEGGVNGCNYRKIENICLKTHT